MKHLPDVRDKLNTGAFDGVISDAVAQFLSGICLFVFSPIAIYMTCLFFSKIKCSLAGKQYRCIGWLAARFYYIQTLLSID